MFANAKMIKASKSGSSGALTKHPVKKRGLLVKEAMIAPAWAISESLEDARLNAIADERSGGPFVQVSLNDL